MSNPIKVLKRPFSIANVVRNTGHVQGMSLNKRELKKGLDGKPGNKTGEKDCKADC